MVHHLVCHLVSRSPGQVAHQQGAKSQGNLQQHHIDLRCKGGMSYPFWIGPLWFALYPFIICWYLLGFTRLLKPNHGHLWFWSLMGLPKTIVWITSIHSGLSASFSFYGFWCLIGKLIRRFSSLGLAGAQQPPRDKKAYIRIDQSWESTWFNIWILNIRWDTLRTH